jgi:hypothetical protein
MSKRVLQTPLTTEEADQLHRRAQLGDLDTVPLALLRRYAFQHQLRWKRKAVGSLLEVVSWHVKTFRPGSRTEATLAQRREVSERQMALQTLDNFEAFRVMAQRAQNLQVVDSNESDLHVRHLARLNKTREKRADEALRRQRNVAEAESIRRSAQHYTSREKRDAEVSRLLGFGPGSQPEAPTELPPWAIRDTRETFDLRSGRFGVEGQARLQELSDGKIKLQDVFASEKEFHVDRGFLPPGDRDTVARLELAESSAREAEEKELSKKREKRRFVVFEALLARNKAKAMMRREEGVKPLAKPQRMVSRLRAGKEHGTL